MEKTIKVINEMLENGLFKEYAIGGGIAIIFYVEPILTYDLDVFFILTTEEEKNLITLSPIYDYLSKKGYSAEKEHIIIEKIPVQFIPAYNELVKEALENAIEIKYKTTKVRIFKAEYLMAIMLETFRPKDKERIIKLIDEANMDINYLKDILKKHNLYDKYNDFMRLYYEQ